MTVFWLLVPIFVAVGVYLIWYSRRTRRLVVDFARGKGLQYHQSDGGQLAGVLDSALSLEQPGLVRSFDRIRDIVYDQDTIALFRTVELLDLNPHGTSESTHHSRVAVTFEVPQQHDLFALVSPDLGCRSRLGSASGVPEEAVGMIRNALQGRPPRCPLSVTLKRGRGLVYLEPLVTGSVRSEDLDYLIAVGRAIRKEFT
jgi:hypothetical protein